MKEEEILKVLPRKVRMHIMAYFAKEHLSCGNLEEIRLRTGKPLLLLCSGREQMPQAERESPYVVTKEDIREMVGYVSNYSLYAYEQEMKQGFITIEGGHRVGMAGQTILEHGRVKNIKYISSVNLRIAHEVYGCADEIFPHITHNKRLCHTMIVSPPGCGKTTLLRDMIRQVSDGNRWVKGRSVGVVDERSEIGGCYMGVAQNELGIRTDILDGCPKAEGMMILIRSMAPHVLAVDELGDPKEVQAMEYAMHCGCKMLATVHGASMEELKKKPLFAQLIRQGRFERYVILEKRKRAGEVQGIYDGAGSPVLWRKSA